MATFKMKLNQRIKGALAAQRPRGGVACRTAMQEAPTQVGPKLDKKYNAPHEVPEEGIDRIVAMLRAGDLFRYGGNGEGALQVRTCACGLRDPAALPGLAAPLCGPHPRREATEHTPLQHLLVRGVAGGRARPWRPRRSCHVSLESIRRERRRWP